MRNILYIEGCNFRDFPLGGTLSFAKQFVQHVDDRFFLVGLGDLEDPIGLWFKKEINGQQFDYFAIGKTREVENTKIPKRIVLYKMLKRHLSRIHETKSDSDLVFSQTPQFVFLISKYKWNKFCFCFAGLGNSVGQSRFKFLRFLGRAYERRLFESLKNHCDVILAAADRNAIVEKALQYHLEPNQIKVFPTRFDEQIFHPSDQISSRNKLGISSETILLVTTGRLSYIKGWKDLIESFRIFHKKFPLSKLVFLGDGEDREKIVNYVQNEIDGGTIEIAGRKSPDEISAYLNAADLFVMFSLLEGWPTAIVEAIACGKNIVTSKVSGVSDMINDGENGYIISNRNPAEFAIAIEKALKLPNPNYTSIRISDKFSSRNLNSDFYNLTSK